MGRLGKQLQPHIHLQYLKLSPSACCCPAVRRDMSHIYSHLPTLEAEVLLHLSNEFPSAEMWLNVFILGEITPSLTLTQYQFSGTGLHRCEGRIWPALFNI